MSKTGDKPRLLGRRRKRVRKRIAQRIRMAGKGDSPPRPRVSVYRSLKHIYAQVIDDVTGQTLTSASSVALKIPGGNVEAAKAVGKALAECAKEKGIREVCFDRNGRLYHGRVKALAEAAREGGLEF